MKKFILALSLPMYILAPPDTPLPISNTGDAALDRERNAFVAAADIYVRKNSFSYQMSLIKITEGHYDAQFPNTHRGDMLKALIKLQANKNR